MIVRNTTKKDLIKLTFGGFEFTLPADSTCAMWSPAAKHFTTKIYHREAKTKEDRGAPVPPLMEVDVKYWDEKTYAQVGRHQIDYTRIPNRNDIIRIAKKRGVDKNYLERFQEEGSELENQDLVEQINKLSVPEEVRLPKVLKAKEETESSKE